MASSWALHSQFQFYFVKVLWLCLFFHLECNISSGRHASLNACAVDITHFNNIVRSEPETHPHLHFKWNMDSIQFNMSGEMRCFIGGKLLKFLRVPLFFAICSKIDLGGAGIIVLGWVETMWKEENTGVKISFRVRGLHFAHRSYWKFEFDPHLMWESWLGNVLISLIWSIGERFMRCRVWGWGERVLFGKRVYWIVRYNEI